MKRQEKKQYMVVGLGRFGSAIAETLCADGVQVLGIDRRIDLVEDMRDHLTQVVQADSTDRDTMLALGVGGVITPQTSSLLHNSGTVAFSLESARAYRDE